MTTSAPRHLRLHADDNVVVAIDPFQKGANVDGVTTRSHVMKGHKLATAVISKGEPVIKFGQVIGIATDTIEPGDHVHVHNCGMADFDRDYRFAEDAGNGSAADNAVPLTFEGFKRRNGKAGTRNYIGVLTSVNCAASVAKFIAQEAERSGLLGDYPNVDGVIAFVHGTGCGMADSGEGFEQFKRLQMGYAMHPNLCSVMMVGLGCEAFQIARMKKECGLEEGENFRTMTIQSEGGTRKSVERGLAMLKEMLPAANSCGRETVPASHLSVALQCGGSDGYSGITANPALGYATDLLVAQGGTGILAETPEIYGAEHLLTRRAASREVGEKLIERIKWWEDYTARNGGEMNNNPSPGNKAGGLTTILEKSLGAAAKGGSTTLKGVYKYAEPVDTSGFVFMDSPGYDPAAVTGQVASGANIVCFTTGRGSAFGYKPAPSVKLATNSDTFARMSEDMDINCGDILEGVAVEDKGKEILDILLKVASGERSKSEQLGYGDHEFVPWQIGAVM